MTRQATPDRHKKASLNRERLIVNGHMLQLVTKHISRIGNATLHSSQRALLTINLSDPEKVNGVNLLTFRL